MPTPFSEAFAGLRSAAGFETAYQFFHKNGGPRVFGCSFPNYLRIEKGTNLPQPQRLPLLCTLLRLPLKSDEMRRLLSAYIETLVGKRDLADWFLAPFSGPAAQPPAVLDPAKEALGKIVREAMKPASMRQYMALMETPATYWCYRVLTSSKEPLGADELSRLLDIKRPEVDEALASLCRVRIVRRASGRRFMSPYAGQFLLFPDPSVIPKEVMDRVWKYNEAMIKKKGSLVDVRYVGVRADLVRLQGFIPHFREAIRSVNAYSVSEKTPHSALVFVEGRIHKLLDF